MKAAAGVPAISNLEMEPSSEVDNTNSNNRGATAARSAAEPKVLRCSTGNGDHSDGNGVSRPRRSSERSSGNIFAQEATSGRSEVYLSEDFRVDREESDYFQQELDGVESDYDVAARPDDDDPTGMWSLEGGVLDGDGDGTANARRADSAFVAIADAEYQADGLGGTSAEADGDSLAGHVSSIDVGGDTYDVDAALGLDAASPASDIEEQDDQQKGWQQIHDYDMKGSLRQSSDSSDHHVEDETQDETVLQTPPHPCLPPPGIPSVLQSQHPSALTQESRAAPGQAAHQASASTHTGLSAAASVTDTAPGVGRGEAGGVAPAKEATAGLRTREEKQQEQLVWQKVRHLLRTRHLQLQQLEVIGWLAWLRIVHRESMRKTSLIAAAALDAYLNFCCRKAAAAYAAKKSQFSKSRSPSHHLSGQFLTPMPEHQWGNADMHHQQRQKHQHPLQRQQKPHQEIEPLYPADGAAAFAFLRETFQRKHASTATGPREIAASGAAHHHQQPVIAAAAAARTAETAADAAYLAKQAITRQHHTYRNSTQDSLTTIKGGGHSCASGEGSCSRTSRGRSIRGVTTSRHVFESRETVGTDPEQAAAACTTEPAAAGVAGLAVSQLLQMQQQQQRQCESRVLWLTSRRPPDAFAAAGLAAAAPTISSGWRQRTLLAFGGGSLRFRLLRAIERKRGTDAMLAIVRHDSGSRTLTLSIVA